MRYILKPGVKLTKYRCPLCGQEELLSEDEKSKCSNCGEDMSALVETEIIKVEKVTEEKEVPESKLGMPGWSKELIPKKKPGRPPKAVTMSGSCSSCSKAMRAIGGLTCKETCETVKGTDICSLYKQGVPVGSKYAD